jgi:DNA modification methylase
LCRDNWGLTVKSSETFLDGRVTLHPGDCLDVLARLDECSVDSVVCDPPYHLTSIVKRFGAENAAPAKSGKSGAYKRASSGFMGEQWDGGDVAFRPETWAAVLRVLKPGGHLVAFSGTRTYHDMATAIAAAGFEIRDQLAWIYGSGFPKSHDVSKGIDRTAGAEREVVGPNKFSHLNGAANLNVYGNASRPDETAPATDSAREWQGWGTALKPAWEPICLARKPLIGTVAANVLAHGTGAINIDGCRVATGEDLNGGRYSDNKQGDDGNTYGSGINLRSMPDYSQPLGRWPANIIHDGSDEVVGAFPETSGKIGMTQHGSGTNGVYGKFHRSEQSLVNDGISDQGSAARFFYTAKADDYDRIGSKHPTVKPVDLMQWLVRLVTPKGGLVLDPFAGTGTTGEAAYREGMNAILIEREAEYQNDIRRRMKLVLSGPDEKRRESLKARGLVEDAGPLFGSR